MPLFRRLETHVLAAARLHGDHTTVPVLASGKTDTGRLWVYVRDDRPFAGPEPPAAVFHYSRHRLRDQPPPHTRDGPGVLQPHAHGAHRELHAPTRVPCALLEARHGCPRPPRLLPPH